jgi:23S rRNA (guanine745-N1)-methyltransferase
VPEAHRTPVLPGVGLAHPAILAALRCPLEGGPVTLEDRTLRCATGHAFDLARQGYVNLATGRDAGTGDDAAMVAAREEVFAAGRFAALGAALAEVVGEVTRPAEADADADAGAPAEAHPAAVVVDLGAGTGHHLASVVGRSDHLVGIALDLSKPALRRAARRDPRIGAVLTDVWGPLPLGTGTATVVTCVFAPRNGPEIARVLRADGALVVATPTASHLAELVGPLGLLTVDPRKDERLAAGLAAHLEPAEDERLVEERWTLDHADVRAVVAMGPSADHLATDDLTVRVASLPDRVEVTSSVQVRTFRPRRDHLGHR